MKILFLINNMETGGAQRLVGDLIECFSRREDMEIGIVTILPSKDSPLLLALKNNKKVRVFELKGGRRPSLGTLHQIRTIAKTYDIIHAHLFPTGYIAATSISNKPMVYTEHSTYNRRRDHKWLRFIERGVYNRYSSIVSISPEVDNKLKNWLHNKYIAKKCTVISNGTDLSKFHGDIEPVPEITKKEGIPLLMISRFTASKDQECVIRALPMIHEDAYIIFVGEGETEEGVKALAEELGVRHRCIFLGTRPDIPEIVKACHIGIQASNWEGFGLSAIEMMAGGLPVVASDVPGLKEVVEGAGLIFRKGNEKDLAEKINLLIHNQPLYKEIAQKCINRSNDYDIQTTATAYFNLYGSLLKGIEMKEGD